eukprot:Hpha_TRINITY_DN7693_c0_g1::TRINITY_DN7693_c0_g1_i1::g.19292::m.19292
MRELVSMQGCANVTVPAGARGVVAGPGPGKTVRVKFPSCVMVVRRSGDVCDPAYMLNQGRVVRLRRKLHQFSKGTYGIVARTEPPFVWIRFESSPSEVQAHKGLLETKAAVYRRGAQQRDEEVARGVMMEQERSVREALAILFQEREHEDARPSEVVRDLVDELTAPQCMGVEPWLSTVGRSTVSTAALRRVIATHDTTAASEGRHAFWYAYGLRTWEGVGVDRDEEAARLWFTRSAAAGHAPALNMLGVLAHLQGDLEGAVTSFREAAEQGSVAGAFNLALVSEEGSLWRQAAKMGHPVAMLHYAGHKSGRGRLSVLQGAAGSGLTEAQFAYANALVERKRNTDDMRTAEGMYRLAAEKGWAEAQYRLACLLLGVWGPKRRDTHFQLNQGRALVVAVDGHTRTKAADALGAEWITGAVARAEEAISLISGTDETRRFVVLVVDLRRQPGTAMPAGEAAIQALRAQDARSSLPETPTVAFVGTRAEQLTARRLGVTYVLESRCTDTELIDACVAAVRSHERAMAHVLEQHSPWPAPSAHKATGPASAVRCLGESIRRRIGKVGPVSRPAEEAERWLRRAAAQDHAEAANGLGFLLAHGGPLGDASADRLQEAAHWYAKAADLGVEDAKLNLRCFLQPPSGVPLEREALQWWWAFGRRWAPPAALNDPDIGEGSRREEEEEEVVVAVEEEQEMQSEEDSEEVEEAVEEPEVFTPMQNEKWLVGDKVCFQGPSQTQTRAIVLSHDKRRGEVKLLCAGGAIMLGPEDCVAAWSTPREEMPLLTPLFPRPSHCQF